MPAMERLYRRCPRGGFELVAVSVDEDPGSCGSSRLRVAQPSRSLLDPTQPSPRRTRPPASPSRCWSTGTASSSSATSAPGTGTPRATSSASAACWKASDPERAQNGAAASVDKRVFGTLRRRRPLGGRPSGESPLMAPALLAAVPLAVAASETREGGWGSGCATTLVIGDPGGRIALRARAGRAPRLEEEAALGRRPSRWSARSGRSSWSWRCPAR